MTTTVLDVPDLDALDPTGARACLWSEVDMFPGTDTTDAKRVCGPCPIREACRVAARAIPGLLGVWGGEDERDRAGRPRRGRPRLRAITSTTPLSVHPRPCRGCGARMYCRRNGASLAGLVVHRADDLCGRCHRAAHGGTRSTGTGAHTRPAGPLDLNLCPSPCRVCGQPMYRRRNGVPADGRRLHRSGGVCVRCPKPSVA